MPDLPFQRCSAAGLDVGPANHGWHTCTCNRHLPKSTPAPLLTDLLTQPPLNAGNDVGPANDIERAYAIFIIVGGACFYAIIIGSMSVLVNSLNPTASRHKFKKDMVANTVRWVPARADL